MSTILRETYPVGMLQCNCTLLGDPATGEAILFDPGWGAGTAGGEAGSTAHLLARLAHHGLRLTQIVVTHAHIDHVGGALALREATGAPIFMHQADLPLLGMMEMQAGWLGMAPPPVMPPDASADDGLKLTFSGAAGEVIHTPGHTPGSICVHFPAASLLIAGDTLFAGSIGRTDLPGGDGRLILQSIQSRLLHLPETTVVIPGHGQKTTIGAERAENPFLRDLR